MKKFSITKILSSRFVVLVDNLPRTLRLVWDCGPQWTLASIVLLVIQGSLPLVSLYLLKLIIDSVSFILSSPDPAVDFQSVSWLIMALGGVAVVGAIVSTLSGLVSRAMSQAISDYMQSLLLQKSIEVDLEYFENPKYYDALHRAQQEANWRPREILLTLIQIGQSGVALLAMVGLLLWFHWAVVLILVMSIIPDMFVRLRYADKFFHWQRSCTQDERQANYLNWVLTRDFYVKEIRLFHLGTLFKRWFDEIRLRLRKERLMINTQRAYAELIAQSTVVLAIFSVYVFLAYRTTQGVLTLGDFVMYFHAIQRSVDYLKAMGGNLAKFYENSLFLTNVYEFLALKPIVQEPVQPRSLPRSPAHGIVFNHVHFFYPNCSSKVLNDFSLTIQPGEHIALVGENGAGKSTLVKLLCRLYDPTEGNITVDGIDIREFGTEDLRKEFGVMFQDFARYQLTAKNNIWVGNTDLSPKSDQIRLAAKQSGADESITRLPLGYDNMLGRWFDEGAELSLGEWQKVALARAFLRDAPVIILDEPSSALDVKSEFDLFKRFHELTKGRTAILISHRLSTVKMVDCIYVLDNGVIIENGTHDSLIEQDGEYAKLFSLQSHHYR